MDPTSRDMSGWDRYSRQMRFAPIGEAGQRKLLAARVLICGCGALGSVLANTLARAGVGRLRLVDRDFLEWNNLQRQVLYDEGDVRAGLPKAVAAADKLRRINSQVEVEAHVVDIDATRIGALVDGVDVILDGTDNFETRFLINDVAVQRKLPWIYGGCLGAVGQTMTIVPGRTPCFRCLYSEPPPPGMTETCDAAGVLAPIVNVVASLQACEALKILSGNVETVSPFLQIFEIWDNRVRQIKLDNLRDNSDCPACQGSDFPWLDGRQGSQTAVLCGRNAVQIRSLAAQTMDLGDLERRLAGIGRIARNAYLLRLELDRHTLTVFPDGRTIVQGTQDIAEAKSLCARYVGS